MKIKVEIDKSLAEEELVIRCPYLSPAVQSLRRAVQEAVQGKERLVFYKGQTEYYLSPAEVLFFETDGKTLCAHTAREAYRVHYKLYELEELLPRYFLRVSKSAILNTRLVYSIDRDLTAPSTVRFAGSCKQVCVSRRYFKLLRDKLEEKRVKP